QTAAAECGTASGSDPRTTAPGRHVGERYGAVELMARGVEGRGEQHGADPEAERAQQDDHEQPHTRGRRRGRVRYRRIEDAEVLPFLALLHVFVELGFLIALQEGLIELARPVVIAGDLPVLLSPPLPVPDPRF